MTKIELFQQHLDTLEQRFQTLKDRAGVLAEGKEALTPALEEVAQAIAALRAAKGAGSRPLEDSPAGTAGLPDVTERELLQKTLQASEAKYRELVESANSIILRWDPQGRLTFVNKFAQDLFEYSEEEIIGKGVIGTIVPEKESSGRDLVALMEEIRCNPDDYRVNENENITKSGKRLWVSWMNKGVKDAAGNLVEILSIGIDTTAKKEAEQALEFRAQLLDMARDSILAHDLEGTLVYANEAAAQNTGFSEVELLGKQIHDLVAPEQRQQSLQRLRALQAGEPLEPFESVHVRKDGIKFPIEVYGRLSQVGGKKVFLGVARDITEREKAQEALAIHLEFMRVMLDAIPNPIFYKDAQGEYLGCNKAFGELVGVTPEEIAGKTVYDVHCKEMADKYHQMDSAMFQNPGNQVYEWPMQVADGSVLHAVVHKATFHDAEGKVAGLVGNIMDISDLKRAEEAVRESEAQLRAIFEHAPVGITVLDPKGRFVQTNPTFQAIVGYGAAELRSLKCPQITHPEDLPEQKRLHRELLAGQRQYYSIEKRYMRKDGDIVWVNMMMAHLLNLQGEPRTVGTFIDITARKRAEEALHESEQRFRLMAETIQDVFWIATPGIRSTKYVSPGYEKVWGQATKELSQDPRAFLETIHPEDRERVNSGILEAQEKQIPWSHEYRIIKPDGEIRWIQDRGFPVMEEQGQVNLYTGVAKDITERKSLEKQLLLAQKMEAVGRLAGGVAHDFNNLLMAIASYGEIMREKILKDDPLYGYLEDILKATERATALTKQLLTFSRQQIVYPQVLDLNRVVLDLESMLRRLIAEDIALKIITAPELGKVKADPGYLNQIIMNLVINARDSLLCGGQIVVETREVTFETSHRTRFGLAPPGRYVVLEVSDSGIGMDEEIQAHIFEPFFTTKEPGKGTGLGLSIVYGIIRQSGGFIDLESEPGLGSTFSIYLPRLESVTESALSTPREQKRFRGKESILLVEDEEVLRILLAKFLRLHGYTVLEAQHGDEALRICKEHQGPIHVMVTDVVMPQMGGRVLADRIRPLRPKMKVLYMSGYTEDEVVQRGVANLSVAFLQKPFKPIELARQVRSLLQSSGQK